MQLWRVLFRRFLAALTSDEQAAAAFAGLARQPAMQRTALNIADFLGRELLPWLKRERARDGGEGCAEIGRRGSAAARALRLGLASTIAE